MTGPFWHFAAMLLRHRVLALTAMVCAVISAAGLGSGLVALGPMLDIVLGEAGSLQAIAAKFSVDHPTLAIPDSLIQMLPADARGSLAAVLSGLGVMTVIGATANFLHQYISISLCSGIVARIRLEAFAHSIRLPLTTVVARGPAEFTSRILRDAGELQSGLSTLTSRMVSQVLKGVASFAAAIWFDWRLTLFALVCGPIIAVILRKAGKQIRRGIRGSLEAQQGLLRVAGESLQGLRSIKSARAESEMIRRFGALNREALSQELRARIARAAASPVIEVIGILVAVGLAYVAGVQILKGQARFEDFLLAMGSLAAMGSSLRPVTGFITELQAANAPASRLLELLDSPLERSGESEKRIAPRFSKELRLDHVT
ncbi:MAG: ABC transporter transmembrane domain-containing protein, partial [Planctomycetota bacterium]|nr:ABC transporter transmembrane domain-containing protein [Planctomycetota bacterium]